MTTTLCTYTELQQLTGTTLSQTILESIINHAEREIAAELAKYDLSLVENSTLKSACLELAVAGVLSRQRMDGTLPDEITTGDISLRLNTVASIEQHRVVAWSLVRMYIDENRAGGISRKYYIALTNKK